MPYNHSMSRIAAILFPAILFTSQANANNIQIDFDTTTQYDDNVGNAYGRNTLFDYGQSAGVTLSSPTFPLNSYSGLSFSGNLHYDQNVRFQGLSHMTVGAEAGYRIQPVPGFTQPWLDVRSSAILLQHTDSAIRDGGIFSLTGRVGKQLTDRIGVSIGGGVEIRRSETGDVFDYRRNKLLASLEYRALDDVMVRVNAQRMIGDVVTTVTVPSELLALSNARAYDSALSSDLFRVAYRVGGRTDMIEMTVTVPITYEHMIDLGVGTWASHTSPGESYYTTQIHAGYTYRFQ
jgi:hypothetical protein